MSSYKGIYVQKSNTRRIESVQVEDSFGNQLPLDPQDYLRRGIQPAMEQLPSAEEYAAQKGKP